MSGKWQGFTDEDIQLMSRKETSTPGKYIQKRNLKQKSEGSKKVFGKSAFEGHKSVNVEEIPSAARLSKPKETTEVNENISTAKNESDNEKENLEKNIQITSTKAETLEESPAISTVCLKIKNNVAYEVIGNEGKSNNTTLSDFHFRQKMMEEQNRKRKELLAQALAERKKKTRAEAHRLQEIQEELQKLDNLLSNDVSILRNQIEAACLDFTEAQKRYDKAEKEFLDAKIVLFNKMEKKELLTSHLCTIIEQNELRKAKKLSELMEKLQISTSNMEINESPTKNVPSLISNVDEIVYAGTTTIKDPRLKNQLKECPPDECTNGNTEEAQLSDKNQLELPAAVQNSLPSDLNDNQ